MATFPKDYGEVASKNKPEDIKLLFNNLNNFFLNKKYQLNLFRGKNFSNIDEIKTIDVNKKIYSFKGVETYIDKIMFLYGHACRENATLLLLFTKALPLLNKEKEEVSSDFVIETDRASFYKGEKISEQERNAGYVEINGKNEKIDYKLLKDREIFAHDSVLLLTSQYSNANQDKNDEFKQKVYDDYNRKKITITKENFMHYFDKYTEYMHPTIIHFR